MKKKKLSELTKVDSLGENERVVSLSSDLKTIMATTKGSLTNILSFADRTGFNGNNGHDLYDSGITLLLITAGVADYGFPNDTGMLLHFQRLPKGNATISQTISQIFFTGPQVYYRYGKGINTTVDYQPWKTFVFA